eukprot:6468974-Amphidinium_carterae.2
MTLADIILTGLAAEAMPGVSSTRAILSQALRSSTMASSSSIVTEAQFLSDAVCWKTESLQTFRALSLQGRLTSVQLIKLAYGSVCAARCTPALEREGVEGDLNTNC